MSRQRLTLYLALAFGASAASLVACGGSASETPPPLEPDPRGFHYGPAQATPAAESEAAEPPRAVPSSDSEAAKRQPLK